jgi:multiple sugar transport system permease protein
MKVSISKRRFSETIQGYIYIMPWILGFLLFTGGPIVRSLIYSFHNWEILLPPEWAGLTNYVKIFTEDHLFRKSLFVTFYYAGGIPLRLIGALAIAMILNQNLRGLSFYRTIYYMPTVVSGVAVALLWLWVFNPEAGVINFMLSKVGIKGPEWFWSEEWVLPAFIIISLWGVGQPMLIYLAGLQGIPTQFYEAAEIDGANPWHKFWHVTFPMLSPVIFFNLVMQIIMSFQVFTAAFIITNGGPANASLFYVLYLYRNAFQWFRMGYASALAWVLFAIIMFFTLLAFRSSSLWVYYESAKRR